PALCVHFFLSIAPPRSSPLFPYTTLFRSDLPKAVGFPHGASILDVHRRETRRLHEEAQDVGVNRLRVGEVAQIGFEERHPAPRIDRKSTRLNSSHVKTSYAVFCLTKRQPV